MFLSFLHEKLFEENFFCCLSAKHWQSEGTANYKHLRWEFLGETHTPLWVLIRRIIFFMCENYCSFLWLVRTHLSVNIYDIAFWWIFLSMYRYIIKFLTARLLSMVVVWNHKSACAAHTLISINKLKIIVRVTCNSNLSYSTTRTRSVRINMKEQ